MTIAMPTRTSADIYCLIKPFLWKGKLAGAILCQLAFSLVLLFQVYQSRTEKFTPDLIPDCKPGRLGWQFWHVL